MREHAPPAASNTIDAAPSGDLLLWVGNPDHRLLARLALAALVESEHSGSAREEFGRLATDFEAASGPQWLRQVQSKMLGAFRADPELVRGYYAAIADPSCCSTPSPFSIWCSATCRNTYIRS